MNALATPLMTTEELLALPDDGIERWLIRGELRERPMTVRNETHSEVMSQIVFLLLLWRNQQLEPRGRVLSGEVGCRLPGTPESTVGIDVTFVGPEIPRNPSGGPTIVHGVPTLVVEILSPSTTQEALHEKIRVYRRAGVPLIWVVDPDDQTIRIYRPQGAPTLATGDIELVGDPHMPGLRIPARELFV